MPCISRTQSEDTVTMQIAACGRYIRLWNIQRQKARSKRPMNQHFVIC